ncbi:MAG: YARHG domain-containing protein, partial [Acidobacteriota bacterium]|nr:YARHG domain-containing protein [Acidobacteriota bacterium]
MKRKIILSLFLVLSCGAAVFAQDGDFKAEQRQAWTKFNRQGWDKIDYTKKKLTKAQVAKLSGDGTIDELALVRGVVFGKRGRIFKERSIQDYLEKQTWYKSKANFTNAVLTKTERDNLDVIRLTEAARHSSIKPGDLRYWEAKEIPDDNIYADTPSDWRVMIAEVEAIHGRRFDSEPWLQKYFEDRYWYQADANYSPTVLTEIERKNLEKLNAKRNEDRNVALSVGDMDKFQTVLLTEDLLKNLSMSDLRLIRNEFWARAGRKFTTPGFRSVFEWQDWYKPLKDQSQVKLSDIELRNVKFIEREEAA